MAFDWLFLVGIGAVAVAAVGILIYFLLGKRDE